MNRQQKIHDRTGRQKSKHRSRTGAVLFVVLMLTAVGLTLGGCGTRYELLLDSSTESVRRTADADSADGGFAADTDDTDDIEADGAADAGAGQLGTDMRAADDAGADSASSAAAEVYVYVCGAVHTPGVYRLPADSRIFEAIEMAGGLTDEADAASLNQAQRLDDGQQITVYTTDETEAMRAGGTAVDTAAVIAGIGAGGSGAGGAEEASDASGTGGSGGRINLNTADRDELMTLSGIGETRAAAILAYREQYGAFSSIEELMQISGIGEKSFQKIRDQITV